MVLPRNRTRPIDISGQSFRWLASMHWEFEVAPDGRKWKKAPRFVDLHVEHDSLPGGTLQVRFSVDMLSAWGWQVREHRRPLPDALVDRTIRCALRDGWVPGETDFALPSHRLPFLRTSRHLLYTEPVIVRVRVVDTIELSPDAVSIQAAVIQPIRGRTDTEFSFTAALPAAHIPEQALVFLHPDADGVLTTWPWFAGVFRIAGGDVLTYDNSGLEHRWSFQVLSEVLQEVSAMHGAREEE